MIESYLNTKTFTSKQELMAKTEMCEREVRRAISDLKKTKAVIYSSQTKGHKLGATQEEIENMSLDELAKELNLVNHTQNDIKARINDLSSELPPLNDYRYEVERVYVRKTNEEFYK